jgi:hypothetical protein
MTHRLAARAVALIILFAPAPACAQGPPPVPLRAVELFEQLPNGGIIEIQREADDSAGMRAVRVRLREMARVFTAGDFDAPASARLTSAPGARVMIQRRGAIRFDYRELPRGAALRITTTDFTARKAIWEFVAYQRNEGMAGER